MSGSPKGPGTLGKGDHDDEVTPHEHVALSLALSQPPTLALALTLTLSLTLSLSLSLSLSLPPLVPLKPPKNRCIHLAGPLQM